MNARCEVLESDAVIVAGNDAHVVSILAIMRDKIESADDEFCDLRGGRVDFIL